MIYLPLSSMPKLGMPSLNSLLKKEINTMKFKVFAVAAVLLLSLSAQAATAFTCCDNPACCDSSNCCN
jgi:hypothetical protein